MNDARTAVGEICPSAFADETVLPSFLATFDAVVNDAVRSFKFRTKEFIDGKRYNGENEAEWKQNGQCPSQRHLRKFYVIVQLN